MFAKDLEHLFHLLTTEGDFRPYAPRDMEERFKSLRGYGKLPRGREKRGQHLAVAEIAAAVLGLVPAHPAWAGHAVAVLNGLRPVGGTQASFDGAATLANTIEGILTNEASADGFLDLALSAAAFGTNNSGFAVLRWQSGGVERTTHFVSELAVSLMQPGAEKAFRPEELRSTFSRIVVLSTRFFSELRREIELSLIRPGEPAGDGSEYDEAEAHQARAARLGARPGSRFLHLGVDTQATWPKEEMVVAFDRYRLVLMPRTKEHAPSVHIDLHAHRLSDEEGMTVVNRFLSLLAWCDDQFAVPQDGWSGNPVPVAVLKRNLGATTAAYWSFERQIPDSEKARRALGHYREARNAEHAGLISYAVLSYYKVIECGRNDDDAKVKAWITRNYLIVAEAHADDPGFDRFREAVGPGSAEKYISGACRVAVAHGSRRFPSDVDNLDEVRRLHVAAAVLRALARRMIGHELGVSENPWEGRPGTGES